MCVGGWCFSSGGWASMRRWLGALLLLVLTVVDAQAQAQPRRARASAATRVQTPPVQSTPSSTLPPETCAVGCGGSPVVPPSHCTQSPMPDRAPDVRRSK